MNYNFAMDDDSGSIFISFDNEKYKDAVAKVDNIHITEENEIEFEYKLPQEKQTFYSDNEYNTALSEAIGDIVKKAFSQSFADETREILENIEAKTKEAFKVYNYTPPEGESFISLFGKKGYVITEDNEGKLIAMNIKSNKTYYFDMPEQLAFLKKEITGSGLILS